jgi:hypothetical protein
MKKRYLFYGMLTICLVSSLLLFNTCKDDEDSSDTTSYRVVQWNYLTDNVIDGKAFFKYEGEKITRITTSDYEYGDSAKTEVAYPENNSAVMIDYNYIGNVWEESFKQEMQFQDELLTQNIYYEYIGGIWEPSNKFSYQYQGSHLTESISYQYDKENWTPFMKTTNEYDGSNLILLLSYIYDGGGWVLYGKQEISYNGDNLDEAIVYSNYEGTLTEAYKYKYNYSGNLLMSIDSYSYDNGTWISDGVYMSFTYDSHGNVESWSDPNDGFMNIQFLYEEGKGNINQLYFQGGFLFGTMIPYPTKSSHHRLDQNGNPVELAGFHPLMK